MTDVATDTSDLESLAASMHVYIPVHLSGEGVSRQLTRTHTSSSTSKKQQQQGEQQQSYLSKIPQNFPVPADCSLTSLRADLEKLTHSKIFLGFVDPLTGGLVELRSDTLEQFGRIADDRKAIHCRLLRKPKSKTEAILAAAEKRQMQQQLEEEEQAEAATAAKRDVKRRPSSAAAMPQTRYEKQQAAIERMTEHASFVHKRKMQALEARVYPQEQQRDEEPHAVAAAAAAAGAAAKQRKETFARLTDYSGHEAHKEQVRERARQQMVDSGYITEPSQFAKTTFESSEEISNRYYGRGVQWLRRRADKSEKAQEAERHRNCVKIKGKAAWEEWAARRARPLVARDRLAAQNEPVLCAIGGGPLRRRGSAGGGAQTPGPQ